MRLIQSGNFQDIYKNIDKELVKAKKLTEEVKEKVKQKKLDQRKHRKNCENIIADIFRLKQDIENKRIDLKRLRSESNALQNKQQKQLNDTLTNNNDNKYHIQDLITEESCKKIINQQQETLNTLINETNEYKQLNQTQKEENNKLSKEHEELKKKALSYDRYLSSQNSQRGNQPQQNKELIELQQNLESMKRLFCIKKLVINNNNQIIIEFESSSKQVYTIQIGLQIFQNNDNENKDNDNDHYYQILMENVQIMNNNTKYKEIVDSVMSKYRKPTMSVSDGNDDGDMFLVPFMNLKKIVMEILCILKRLPLRYRDITTLYESYNDKQDVFHPWLPEADQLVFTFKFKQNVSSGNMVINDDDDDQKMSDLNEREVMIDVHLVISISWNYPRREFVDDNQVITVSGYNCSLSEKKLVDVERKWNNILNETVNEVSGQHQNDIVNFVNFIHDKLQHFADGN